MDNNKFFTTIGENYRSKVTPATIDEFFAWRDKQEVMDLSERILAESDEEKQKELKSQLPVWTPRCAQFADNHRLAEKALRPLNRQMFDIDEKGHTDEILQLMQKGTDNSNELFISNFKILLVEESVRKGTHVLTIPPAHLSLQEAQLRFAELTGLKVDASVKNVAGCIYMVPRAYIKYIAEDFADPDAINPLDYGMEDQLQENRLDDVASASSPAMAAAYFPDDFNGIPYPLIVDALAEQLGGVPAHGARNNFLFIMACNLRYVCDDNPAWIERILPNYGEDQQKLRNTIKSACNRPQNQGQPQLLQRALANAKMRLEVKLQAETGKSYLTRNQPPAMPARLPAPIKLLVSRLPDIYRPSVAIGVFAPLGAHLRGVKVKYIDNVAHELGGFMSACIADQSAGKSSINALVEEIMADIHVRDKESRTLEAAWKEECRRAKASEKKPKRPVDICVQHLMSNTTNAALVQRLMDADNNGGKFLYMLMPEIEMLYNIRQSGGCTPSEVIRLAYDQSLYGQERVGHDSITGTPPLRLNFNVAATPVSARRFFRRDLVNGTLSRIALSTIIRQGIGTEIPVFGNYDEDFRSRLRPYIDRLNSTSGMVVCQQAAKMATRFVKENAEFAALSGDEVFEVFSFRALRMAFDRAVVLYILQGKWTKDIADFCRWSMQYDLWCKLHFFGEQIRCASQVEQPSTPGPQNLLDLLPNPFDIVSLQTVYGAQGLHGKAKDVLYTWKKRGYVVECAIKGTWKKTDKYLSKKK